MRIFWWQAGLHIHPETKEESAALGLLTRALEERGLDLSDGHKNGALAGQVQQSSGEEAP